MTKIKIIPFNILLIVFTALVSCISRNSQIYEPTTQMAFEASPTIVTTTHPDNPNNPVATSTSVSNEISTSTTPLEPEVAKETIRRFFTENVKCALPCFWGLIPGETTFIEAENLFVQLRYPLNLTQNLDGMQYYATSPMIDNFSISVVLTVKSDFIDGIRTTMDINNATLIPKDKWRMFSIPFVLQTYGKPTDIRFFVTYASQGDRSSGNAHYSMVLHFSEAKFIISYELADTVQGQYIHVCPNTDQFTTIRTWLGDNPSSKPRVHGVAIEDAASLSIDDFYNRIMADNNLCFSLIEGEFSP